MHLASYCTGATSPTFLRRVFPTIHRLNLLVRKLDKANLKVVYEALKYDVLTLDSSNEDDNSDNIQPRIPLKCKVKFPDNNWPEAWRKARLPGLGPELTSFLLELSIVWLTASMQSSTWLQRKGGRVSRAKTRADWRQGAGC